MCVSPLVRFRVKYKLDPKDDVSSYFYSFPYAEFNIKSKKKLESLFKDHSHYLSFMDSYCDYQELPCGKCVECRRTYSRDWSVRCYHESLCHTANCFITLTLDNLANKRFEEEIERSCKNGTNKYCKNCVNGSRYYKYSIDYSLAKGFILGWIKKFRDYLYRNYKISIRYFGCGEYGSLNERPHYHILIFGYNFPTITKNNRIKYRTFDDIFSKKGVRMKISEELQHLWPYGMSYVEDLNMYACSYVAQYVMKKQKSFDDTDEYFDFYYGRVPEFLFMSKGNCQVNRCKFIDKICKDNYNSLRNVNIPYCHKCNKTRGGLGYNWLMKYYHDVIKLGYIVIDGKKYPFPKYYMDIIKLTDYEKYIDIKLHNIYYINDQILNGSDENSTERNEIRRTIENKRIRTQVSRDI